MCENKKKTKFTMMSRYVCNFFLSAFISQSFATFWLVRLRDIIRSQEKRKTRALFSAAFRWKSNEAEKVFPAPFAFNKKITGNHLQTYRYRRFSLPSFL